MSIIKELIAKFSADTSDFDKKTKGTERKSKSFTDKMVGFAKLIAAAWVFKKVYDSLRQLIGGMTQMADRLRDLSDMTDISTDTLQEYQYVAKIAGVNTEALANASHGLTQRLARGLTEMSPLNVALKQLGLRAHDASGKLRSGADIMDDVIKRLADMDDVTQRNVLGAQIFAGAWKDMAPILGMGAEGIEKLRKEAHDLGIVMSEDAIDSANELRMAQVRLKEASSALGRELGSVLIPILTKLTEATLSSISALRTFRSAMSAVINSEDLRWWQKIGVFLGVTTGSAKDLGTMFREMAKVEEKANQEREKTIPTTNNASQANQEYADVLEKVNAQHKDFTGTAASSDEALIKLIDSVDFGTGRLGRLVEKMTWIRKEMTLLEQATRDWAEQIMFAGINAEGSIKDFGKTLARETRRAIAAFLAQAIAARIASLATTGMGLLLAPAAAGAIVGTFNALIPHFQYGGAVSGPTLALIGEGPGVSRANPEYVGTADQIAHMGGRSEIVGYRVAGGDLLFLIEEAKSGHTRKYG